MKTVAAQNLTDPGRLSEMPLISPSAVIRDCRFGAYTEVMDGVEMAESMLEDYSYVCRFSSIISTDIGKFCNIADLVRINPGNHPMERPSQHHFTYRSERYGFTEEPDEAFFNWRGRQRVQVGHDVWLGHGAVVMPGVRIGDGAVVGSMSVVTKDVPAYAVVAGSPARVLRRRFPADIASALREMRWWDWPHAVIGERLEDFKDIRRFLDKYAD